MSELVKRLSESDNPVVLGDASLSGAELYARITRLRTVPLTFPGTRGGTTLDLAVDSRPAPSSTPPTSRRARAGCTSRGP